MEVADRIVDTISRRQNAANNDGDERRGDHRWRREMTQGKARGHVVAAAAFVRQKHWSTDKCLSDVELSALDFG